MNKLSPPPVPQKLRKMLKDYPEHIARLQEVLRHVVETSSDGVDPFDRAIWALEGRLDTFHSEAREELKAAEALGDAEAAARADQRERLMSRAGSSNGGMKGLHELWLYFEKYKVTNTDNNANTPP